jgi:hypothetical protein
MNVNIDQDIINLALARRGGQVESSSSDNEKIGAMGREIEFRHGTG